MKRRPGRFGCMGTKLIAHPKAFKAKLLGLGMLTYCTLWSQEYEQDGFIPGSAVRTALEDPEVGAAIQRCVDVGWLVPHETEDGFHVFGFLEWNMSQKEIRNAKTRAKERMKAFRNKDKSSLHCNGEQTENKRVQNAVVSSSSSSSIFDQGSGLGESAERGAAQARYRGAYCDGIAEGKGGPYAWPGSQWDDGDLAKAILTFAKHPETRKPARGELLLRWIRDAAADFAEDVAKREEVRFYSSFRPKGFLRWLNEQERAEEAKRVG